MSDQELTQQAQEALDRFVLEMGDIGDFLTIQWPNGTPVFAVLHPDQSDDSVPQYMLRALCDVGWRLTVTSGSQPGNERPGKGEQG